MPIHRQNRTPPTAADRERSKALALKQIGATPEGREALARHGSPEAVRDAVAPASRAAASPILTGQAARDRGKALAAAEVRRMGMTPKL